MIALVVDTFADGTGVMTTVADPIRKASSSSKSA